MDKEKESLKKEKYERVYAIYQQKISGKILIFRQREITLQKIKEGKIFKKTLSVNPNPK